MRDSKSDYATAADCFDSMAGACTRVCTSKPENDNADTFYATLAGTPPQDAGTVAWSRSWNLPRRRRPSPCRDSLTLTLSRRVRGPPPLARRRADQLAADGLPDSFGRGILGGTV